MPTRTCLEPRCPHPATTRGRCTTHARTTNRITHNPAHKHIYNSQRWRYLRRHILLNHPICQTCGHELALDVDHIISLDTGGNPWDPANLQALCRPCHSTKTRQEQAA